MPKPSYSSPLVALLTGLLLGSSALLAADQPTAADFKAMRTEVEALSKLTQAPKYEVVDRPDATPNLKPILYTGPDFEGKPTKVFAWLGTPENPKGKVPAIVLVHGGGGTASKDWVKIWTDQGFAAISMSLEGHTDQKGDKGHARNPEGGPVRPGVYGDQTAPIKDQWMYQCVANVTLAAALLRDLPEVDPNKVGIMGVSWGGIITATVIGIDPRYTFAISVYGCGGLDKIPNHYEKTLANNDVYREVWDSHLRLENAKMPILWLSWPQDKHFPMDALTLSRNLKSTGDSMLCLIPEMGHGGKGGDREDSYTFAKNILQDGRPWLLQKSQKVAGSKIQATFDSLKPIDSAVLVSTTDAGITGSRTWVESPRHREPIRISMDCQSGYSRWHNRLFSKSQKRSAHGIVRLYRDQVESTVPLAR